MAGWQDDPIVAPAPSSSGGGWQNDPIVGGEQHGALYNALLKEGGGGSMLASADEGILPAARDYGLAIGDDLTMGALGGSRAPSSVSSLVRQAHSNLGPMDPITSAATYAVGPGKVLGPAGRAIGGAGIGGLAAEGALAGGASHLISNDDATLAGTAAATAGGALLGGAAGAATKGANAAIGGIASRLSPKPPAFDPEAVLATTKANKEANYGTLKNYAFHPDDVYGAHISPTLTPGMAADVSPGMMNMLQRQREAILGGGNTANDIADYISNLKSVSNAPGSSNGDTQLAGKVGSKLEDLLKTSKPITGQAPGQAFDALVSARLAHQRYEMAQNLGEWNRRAEAGAPIGERPLTEAENWYQNKPEQYQTLVDLYQGGKAGFDPSHVAGHTGSEIGGAVGGLVGGWPGHIIGKGVGYFGGKAIGKSLKGSLKGKAQLKALQDAYPSLTGMPAPETQAVPQIGDSIKNLMLGAVY